MSGEQQKQGGHIYDVAVIGAGVAGCCCARELARFNLSCVVLEAGNDIACGATRANSGIVHAGYDPEPGTLRAHFNVAGSRLFPRWADELGFAYVRNESLVVGFDDADRTALQKLLDRGLQNGVEGLSLISGDEARELEPCLSPEVTCALRVRTGVICDPYGVALTSLENAIANGADLEFNARVQRVERGGTYVLALADGRAVHARAVVNAAGVYADEIHNQVCEDELAITPVRGEYLLYDTAIDTRFARTVFQVPTKVGKGILVSPSAYGNLFVGPSATHQDDKDALATSADGLAGVLEGARRTWPEVSMRGVITNFTGVRAKGTNHDFVIGEAPDAPGFFDVACFESPGLTSAPAVATEIAASVAERLGASKKEGFSPRQAPRRRLAFMDEAERESAVAEDPAWGHVVCRCNMVSEAEVVRELHGSIPVLGLDALKWRTGATMGRCHGGFCTPELMRVVAREQGCAPEDLDKRLPGSWMVASSRSDYVDLAQAEGGLAKRDRGHEGCEGHAEDDGHFGSESYLNGVGAQDGALASGVSVDAEVLAPAGIFYDVVVIGGGAAGMAAAAAARDGGAASVLLIDRERTLGGIMRQCVHNGFGLKRFSEELTGPEFAAREGALLEGVDLWLGASVIRLVPGVVASDGSRPWTVLDVVRPEGASRITAAAVVLATGSRERGFGALGIAGDRPSGIYTAGSAQALINLQGCLPGKRAVVLGSGDIGLIMARRMTLEGMEVEGVYELLDHPSGLNRNIVQCLDDFGIPLHLSRTVVATHGPRRLEAVDIAEVDPLTRKPIAGTEVRTPCDTLVLSCGLIPENELAREAGIELSPATGGAMVDERFATSVPGVFACGNALHVHDLADLAAAEGDRAGASAAAWLKDWRNADSAPCIDAQTGDGISGVVPQRVRLDAAGKIAFMFRPARVARGVRFEVVGYQSDGSKRTLRARAARVALPAEMQRLEVNAADLLGVERIELRMAEASKGRAEEAPTGRVHGKDVE